MDHEVFDYNILGAEDDIESHEQMYKAMMTIVEKFSAFIIDIDKAIDANLHKSLYGDLTKEDAQRILQRYPTVEEGMQHIPGKITDEEYPAQQWLVIQAILDKLYALKHFGEAQTISRSAYQRLKRQLLERLFQQFGCGLDLQNLHAAIPRLQNMGMIAPHLTFLEVVDYCPIGRWY